MLQALIFDLDGVVVDSHPAHLCAWKTLLASLGKLVPNHDLQFVLEGQKREDILRHFLGELTDEQLEAYGARKETLFKDAASGLQAVNGVLEFLDQVEGEGLPIALASSASRNRVEYTLEQLGLTGRFRVVVTGSDVVKGKPDPALFHAAADGMGVEPSGILVCEDAVNGVEAAKTAGMRCLAIAANGRTQLLQKAGADKIVPDFTATSLDELRGLFVGQA
jgi:HAD superfamily hydrolase (TIGR01509 family)